MRIMRISGQVYSEIDMAPSLEEFLAAGTFKQMRSRGCFNALILSWLQRNSQQWDQIPSRANRLTYHNLQLCRKPQILNYLA